MKNVKLQLTTAVFLTLGYVASLSAQTCEGESQTSASENFLLVNETDDYVVDTSTGLAWARCVVGQQWDSESLTCTGEAEQMTWQLALQQSDSFVANSISDWRLPNLKELVSIVERQCVEPALNADIFPNAPDDRYWTSTPNTSALATTEAWAVAFYNGRIDSHDKQLDFYVRMVRYAE